MLATGGLGQIYLRTTNPAGSRGDGLAMAYRAGARVINTEYVQFHPTAFYHRNAPVLPDHRGGARRRRAAGRRAAAAVHGPLRPGVEGPRAARRRGARHPPRDAARGAEARLPRPRALHPARADPRRVPDHPTRAACEYGVDITRDLLPVVPAAHYSCGGVWVDEHGHSTLERLYAVGEVSCTGAARREPAGEHVAARGPRLGPARGAPHRGEPRAARRRALRRHPAVEADRDARRPTRR